MNAPSKSVNAWILLAEDEPPGTNYNSPNSSYQSLITNGIYNCVDMLNICFVETVPTSATTVPTGDGSTYTIQLQAQDHDGDTNQDYMNRVIQDAHNANPKIKVLVTLDYSGAQLDQIFSGDESQWQQSATAFANNLVTYLQYYNLAGFDVDWENPLCFGITQEQFQILFTAIRAAFNTQSKHYYLTLSPAETGNLDGDTVNSAIDFLNLQLYSGFTFPNDFIEAGVSQSLLAYGAKFESEYQDAQNAYDGYISGDYSVITQWRLNSDNFQYEQTQQKILYQLVYGVSEASSSPPQRTAQS